MPSLRKVLVALGSSALALLASPSNARADEPAPPPPPAAQATVPHPYAYGILVGSNVGGAGQATLRYAEEDAQKMAQVLRELGRYGTADMKVLVAPDPAKVLAAIDDVAQKMKAHAAKNEQAVLVFYYSGHAKANAFSLGADELPIAALRDKLRQIPSTLTLVVLDACQSGQFARVKGVEPAADFSYNSVSRLTTKGIAVMASSSAQELSQESDSLKGSYFTHHLVTALRGAADADGDGRVSLDEAYKYAYRRTLASTAATKVGGQHVTLETDLAGQGEVPVTYPADAKSQLELPGPLDAKVLVQHKPSGNIVAEVQKAPGAPLRLALTAGSYDAYVRSAGKVVRCKLTLSDDRVTPIDLGGCEEIAQAGVPKGDEDEIGAPEPEPDVPQAPRARFGVEPWSVEAGVGFTGHHEDAYTRRLESFGYARNKDFIELPRARATLAVTKGLFPHVTLGAGLTTLSGDSYSRHLSDSNDSFVWDDYGAFGFVRASTSPFGSTGGARHAYVQLYGQLGAGLTLGVTKLVTGSTKSTATETTNETQWGFLIGGAGGIALVLPRYVTIFGQLGYDYAPTLANLVGDTHDSGGPAMLVGARFRFGE